MALHRRSLLVRGRRYGALALTALASGVIVSCGPSQEEIRTEINTICSELVEDLSALDAAPTFALLASAADEAGFAFGASAFNVEDVSGKSPVDEFASTLHAVSDSYRDIENQITRRDYASLMQTSRDGNASIAAALAAAETVGATDCLEIDVRAEYFDIATHGAQEAAALIAPTGDYVTDANAACDRYAADTFGVYLKLNLRARIADGVEASRDAGDYIEAVEDLLVIGIALDVLVGELEALVPPAEDEAGHVQLIKGYQDAIEGLRQLRTGGGVEQVVASAEEVDEAAQLLGIGCSL